MILQLAFDVPGLLLPLELAAGEPIRMRLVHNRVVLKSTYMGSAIGYSSGKWSRGPGGLVCW